MASFSYDVLGRRISKTIRHSDSVNGIESTTLYIYSGNQVIQETETKDGIEKTKEYVYGNGGVDDIIASIQDNTIYYYHKDQIGSIVGITDGSGNLVSKYEYDVFGKAQLVDGVEIGNTRLFTGREYDSEIELYYYRARYYDADLGRFISRDPIDTSDDVNLYGYVKNNPVNAVDPSGLMAKAAIMEAGDFIGITDASEGLGNVAAFWMGYATDDEVLMSEGEAGMRDSLGKLTNPVAFAMNRLNKMKKMGGLAMGLFGKKAEKIGEEAVKKEESRYISKKIKDEVRERDGNKCKYCGKTTNTDRISNPDKSEIDHKNPYVSSKDNTPGNLQNTCRTCNRSKGTKSDDVFRGLFGF